MSRVNSANGTPRFITLLLERAPAHTARGLVAAHSIVYKYVDTRSPTHPRLPPLLSWYFTGDHEHLAASPTVVYRRTRARPRGIRENEKVPSQNKSACLLAIITIKA